MRALKVAWDNSIAGRDKAGTGVYATQLLQQYATRNDLHVTVLSGWSNSHTGSKPLKRGLGTLQDLLWMHALPARSTLAEKSGCIARACIPRTSGGSLPRRCNRSRRQLSPFHPTFLAGGYSI